MIYRFSTLLLGAMLSWSSFSLKAQGFGLLIDNVTVQSGQEFCVPIKAKDSIEIIALQGIFKWDVQVLNLIKLKNFNLPGLSPSDFNSSSPNQLLFSWTDPTGLCIGRDSGETLFEICFLAIGAAGSSTFVTLDTGEIGICMGIFDLVPLGPDTGNVIISMQSGIFTAQPNEPISFQVSPNPTTSQARVIFQSPGAGKARLLVSDALGRVVLEQKVVVNAGDNQLEIPANALNVKGMYQISLQTEQGVSSQLLSVQ